MKSLNFPLNFVSSQINYDHFRWTNTQVRFGFGLDVKRASSIRENYLRVKASTKPPSNLIIILQNMITGYENDVIDHFLIHLTTTQESYAYDLSIVTTTQHNHSGHRINEWMNRKWPSQLLITVNWAKINI